MKPRTLYDKIWDDHLVDEQPDGTALIYIDRHLVHEVTSPQAFEGLRTAGRKVHAPDKTLAVVDHNVPTSDRTKPNPQKDRSGALLGKVVLKPDGGQRHVFTLEHVDKTSDYELLTARSKPPLAATCPCGATPVCFTLL